LQTDEKKRPQTIEDWQRALTSLEGATQHLTPGSYQQPGAGDAAHTVAAVSGRSQMQQSSPNSQLRDGTPFSEPEETHYYQDKPPRINFKMLVRIAVLAAILGGGAYFAENPDGMRHLAFKIADWGWHSENYEVSLPIYKYYDSPSDSLTPFKIAIQYEKGKGVDIDRAEALAWYKKSAERGNLDAALKIAQMLELGDGVEADSELAVEWYRKAAEQGQIDAQYRLGIAYLRADTLKLTSNPNESTKWLRMAATQGHKQARELLKLTH